MKFYNIEQAQKEALKQINTTFKLSEIGYGQGYHEGKINERKYWQDKIKAKIEEVQNMKAKAKDIIFISSLNYIETELQSLLEKE